MPKVHLGDLNVGGNTRWSELPAEVREIIAKEYALGGTPALTRYLHSAKLTIPVNTVRGYLVRAGVTVSRFVTPDRVLAPRLYEVEVPKKVIKAVFIGDEQVPFADRAVWGRVLRFIQDFKPDLLVHLGDGLDCYSISRFSRDPARVHSLGAELREMNSHLDELDSAAGKAVKLYHLGNHEERLERYVIDRAPELRDIPELSISHLLRLEKRGFEVFESGHMSEFRGFVMTHGVHTGPTAAERMAGATGSSGISGHNHQARAFWWTDLRGPHAWFINPTLMRVDAGEPSYVKGPVNWAQGFSYGTWVGTTWNMTTVVANKSGQFVAEGKLY